MGVTIIPANLATQPFSREPEALAAKCRHFGMDVKAGGNSRDGYCIFGTFEGRAIFFRNAAQVHTACRKISR